MTVRLATAKELHDAYPKLSLYTINDLRRRNKIPYVSIPGRKRLYFYDLDVIEKWLKDAGVPIREQLNNDN